MGKKRSSKNAKAVGNKATSADTTPAATVDTTQIQSTPAEVSRIDSLEDPWTPSQQEQQQQKQQQERREQESDSLPVERAAPRRYEDEEDEEDHHQSERSRLIRTYSDESGTYSDGGRGGGDPTRAAPDGQPTTWLEWAVKTGLHPRTWNRQTYIKAALLVTLLTLIILSLTVFRIQDHIKDILRYIDAHKRVGAILFIVSYTLACTLFLPGSLFTVGAGFLFKPFPLALLIVLAGDVVASVASFIFGRYVFYDWVKSMMSKHPKFNALDQVIQDDGWKIVVMLRLTPIPFSLITYFFSITSIRLWTVVWATCIGVLPGSCIGIWIGSLLKGLSGIDNPELKTRQVVVLVMNGVFITCCIFALSLFGKRSLRKAMKRLDQHQALTNLQEVEIVIEGVATVIRELEDNASIPPSLRSHMVDQLAAEEGDQDYFYRTDLEATQQRLLGDDQQETRGEGESSSATSSTLAVPNNHPHQPSKGQRHQKAAPITPALASSGFTRGEKWTFVAIGVVAVLNVCVCVPLYYHFANQEE
ncbi:hypothetical protein BGX23_004726 [Mortierella sp. AD031]|nr:hypothetical protein BGX23_004726 [Mortierella sp. AD031]KAG0218016.1 hypothetical protein BGX33_008877 [Mortierella sp. NVP41]